MAGNEAGPTDFRMLPGLIYFLARITPKAGMQ